jgi:HD superfamily phosphohydrolase
MSGKIVIHDTVHGSIMMDQCAGELLNVPDFQRLAGIKQLGLSFLVFPGANHTRLEHSIGTYHIAKGLTSVLGLETEEANVVSYAALLHDLGHGPYSHTLEVVLHDSLGIDHMELTRDVIIGKNRMIPEDADILGNGLTVPDVLDNNSVDAKIVGELVRGNSSPIDEQTVLTHNGQQFFNEKKYLSQLIHGPIDCDQIDYLLRDSHYTGVAHGTIDLARLLHTLTIHNHDLVVQDKGLSAIEGMLVARSLMYSSVYFHKTARLAELMLSKAVEMVPDKGSTMEVQKMNDAELMGWLEGLGGFQREIVRRLKYRRLYKVAFGKRVGDLCEKEQERLLEITNDKSWLSIEKAICQRLGLKDGSIIIDVPEPDLFLSEPRISRTDIKVLADGKIKSLSKITPFSKAIQQKKISRWAVVVTCPGNHREAVEKTARKLIFD